MRVGLQGLSRWEKPPLWKRVSSSFVPGLNTKPSRLGLFRWGLDLIFETYGERGIGSFRRRCAFEEEDREANYAHFIISTVLVIYLTPLTVSAQSGSGAVLAPSAEPPQGLLLVVRLGRLLAVWQVQPSGVPSRRISPRR